MTRPGTFLLQPGRAPRRPELLGRFVIGDEACLVNDVVSVFALPHQAPRVRGGSRVRILDRIADPAEIELHYRFLVLDELGRSTRQWQVTEASNVTDAPVLPFWRRLRNRLFDR